MTDLIRTRDVLLEAIVDLADKSREKAAVFRRRVVSEPSHNLMPALGAFIDAMEAFIRTLDALEALKRSVDGRPAARCRFMESSKWC
jgi:hypothetical protein